MIQRKKGSKAKAKPLPIDDREFKRVVAEALQILMGYVGTDSSKKLYDKFEELLNPKSQEMPFKDTLEEK